MNRPVVLGLACGLLALLTGCPSTTGPAPGATGSVAESPATEVGADVKTGEPRRKAQAHTELGKAYLEAGRVAVALEEAQTAIAADDGYAPGHSLLGAVHLALEEKPQALAAFERARRLAPNDGEINNYYGWTLCLSGRQKESIPYFMTAVKNPLYGYPTRPLTNAGLCSMQVKDYAAAEGFLRRAVQADTTNVQAVFLLAETYYHRGNNHEAQRLVGEVQRMLEQPNAATLWLALRIERRLGDRAAEQRYANELRKRFAGSPEYQALIQGQYE